MIFPDVVNPIINYPQVITIFMGATNPPPNGRFMALGFNITRW